MRVFIISDVHVEYPKNMKWVDSIDADDHYGDVLIVAGDLSESLDNLIISLRLFKEKFGHVFFVPGNHDLWVLREKKDGLLTIDSIQKIERIIESCEQEGVFIAPRSLRWERIEGDGSVFSEGELVIAPIWSWTHASWDTEPRLSIDTQPPYYKVMMDFNACKWPIHLDPCPQSDTEIEAAESRAVSLAKYFDGLNDRLCMQASRLPDEVPNAAATAVGTFTSMKQVEEFSNFVSMNGEAERKSAQKEYFRQVVSFSHFLPCVELIPEKRFLFFHDLAKASGSDFLKSRVKSIKPKIHIFGHSHFGWDGYTKEIPGVRFIQACLGYPKERERRLNSMKTGEHFPPNDSNSLKKNDISSENTHSNPYLVCIWEDGEWVAPMKAFWSEQFKNRERDPYDETLPWYLTIPGVPGKIE